MANKNYGLYKVERFSTIREMLELAEREAGESTAFEYKDGSDVVKVSYADFIATTRRLGNAMVTRAMCGCHIACVGDNSYKWVCAYLSVLCSDSVFVPVDRELPDDDLINVLIHSDSEVVFCSEKYEAVFRERRADLPNIKYFICFDTSEDEGVFLSYDRLLESGRALMEGGCDDYAKCKGDPAALKMLVYTSGTTGRAKGVMLSENNLVSCVYYGLQVSTVYDRCLSVLPYNHTYEAVCGLLVSLHHHSTICINDKLRNVLKNLSLFKPSYLYLVPMFSDLFYKKIWATAKETGRDETLRKLIKHSRRLRKLGIDMRRTFFASIHKTFGGELIKIVCGGAPIRPEIGQFFDDIGINLINGYGITECSPLVSANRDKFNDCSTVGVPLPCISVRIEEPDDEGNGEICIKGLTVMLGYYKDEAATAEVLRDGWFHTGDYGSVNDKGQLLISGRKKNLIVLTNGKNIYPEELEALISSVSYVSEVIVSGIRNDAGEETGLRAEVYLDPETIDSAKRDENTAALKADIAAVTAQLPSYKHISEIVIRDEEFPKTTAKKIKRNYTTEPCRA